jgi:transcriptional regulator with XRE-family HTH domain
MEMVDKILRLIEDRGLSQGDFEVAVGLYQGRFSKWKRGQGEIPATDALAMARYLGVPADWLIDPEADFTSLAWDGKVWEVIRAIGPEAAWLRLVGAEGKVAVEDGSTGGRRDPSDGSRSPEAKEPRRRGSA